jgi:hypothetical protein
VKKIFGEIYHEGESACQNITKNYKGETSTVLKNVKNLKSLNIMGNIIKWKKIK